jgi:hypothetical protein
MLTGATVANARLAELPGFLIGDADAVADHGYRACMQGGTVIKIPGVVDHAVTRAMRRSSHFGVARGELARWHAGPFRAPSRATSRR